MKKMVSKLNNEEGSAIVIALIVLVLLTMIGIVSTDNTVFELQIVRNEAIYKQNFYKAEGSVVEAAQWMNDNDLRTANWPTSPAWIADKSTAPDMTDVSQWNWTAAGNSTKSNNMDDAGDANNNTVYAAVRKGYAGGASIDYTKGTLLYSYSVYGLFDSTTGQGRSLIRSGYYKRY